MAEIEMKSKNNHESTHHITHKTAFMVTITSRWTAYQTNLHRATNERNRQMFAHKNPI